ncbi:MAG: (2Fe-2S)-binding protein [Blastocatellia bacterium]|nr:(2Fe-2S)-binding protein [Blastocatellia bacterium]
MEEVEVKFEPSGRDGIVASGTYIIDAAYRFGIRIEDECERKGECDTCAVKILKGAELLSEPTKAELEHLSPERRKKGERLSCQAKIEKIGELVIMTTEKPKPEVPPFETFKKEFAELPLDEKVRKLVDLEAITLSETFNFVLNLPYYIGEKIRDGVAEFGFMKEEAEKKAKRPAEHKTEEKAEEKAEAKADKATKTTKPRVAKAKTATPKKPPTRKRTTKPVADNETSA